jgi:hypothetical protein
MKLELTREQVIERQRIVETVPGLDSFRQSGFLKKLLRDWTTMYAENERLTEKLAKYEKQNRWREEFCGTCKSYLRCHREDRVRVKETPACDEWVPKNRVTCQQPPKKRSSDGDSKRT